MFEHIGAKIKKVVKVFFVLESIIGVFVIGFYTAARYNTLYYFSDSVGRLIIVSILTFVLGTAVWILIARFWRIGRSGRVYRQKTEDEWRSRNSF